MSLLDEFFPRDERGLPYQENGKPIRMPTPEPEKRVSPRFYGSKGEGWQRDRLARVLGITPHKNRDTPYEREDGVVVYPVNFVDYTVVAMLNLGSSEPQRYVLQIEVKTFTGNFPWKQITPAQANILDLARYYRELALIGLCERVGKTIQRGWIIPWRRPSQYPLNTARLEEVASRTGRKNFDREIARKILRQKADLWTELGVRDWADIMDELHTRAAGTFKAKSFRTRDQDLWAEHQWKLTGNGYGPPAWLDTIATPLLQPQQASVPF